jgi:hypothetical protein
VTSFPSLGELHANHTRLLREYHAEGGTEERKAQIAAFIETGRATGVFLDDDGDREAAQQILDHWATLLFRMAGEAPDATLAHFDPAQLPTLRDEDCPYLGLDAFGEDQHVRFFGRRRLLQQCANILLENPLLAVIGQSGSGKSSLVSGGLVPGLKKEELPQFKNSAAWTYLGPIVPGAEPVQNLVSMLQGWVSRQGTACSVTAEEFQREPHLFASLFDGEPGAILIVDQFEETFTLCEDAETRALFMKLLVEFVQKPGGFRRVIISMRSEFETWIARDASLYPMFSAGQIRMVPMDQNELRETIEKPAEGVGLKFESGVVDALLHDTLGEPAALPMLQFALLKLWQTRFHNRISIAAYEKLGGARLALANSANDFFVNLVPENQDTARRILLRMVRVSDGLEVHSQRVKLASLYETGEDRNRVDFVIEELVRAHLVKITAGHSPAPQIEVAHEALIRNWPTLLEWIQRKRTDLLTRRRLNEYAAEWMRRNRATEALLDAELLSEAARWIKSDAAREFGYHESLPKLIEATRTQHNADRDRIEREAEAKQKKRLRLMLTLFVASGLILAGAALLARHVQQLKKEITHQAEMVEKKQREIDELSKRQAVTVEYSANPAEISDVERVLKQARFLATHQAPSPQAPAINTLLYGEKVKLEDVKILAVNLIDAGIRLRRIDTIKGPRASEPVIQLIGASGSLHDSVLTISQIESLAPGQGPDAVRLKPVSTAGAKVLLFVGNDTQRDNVNRVAAALSEVGYSVPSPLNAGERARPSDGNTQIRYFRVNDKAEADFIAKLLAPVDGTMQPNYVNDPQNSRRTTPVFEIWFGKNAFVNDPTAKVEWIPRVFIHARPQSKEQAQRLKAQLEVSGSWAAIFESSAETPVGRVEYSEKVPEDAQEAATVLDALKQLGVSPLAEKPEPAKIESRPRRFEVYLPRTAN